MWYNNTGAVSCHSTVSEDEDGQWGFQYCAEMTFGFSAGYPFRPSQFNLTETSEGCVKRWGVAPNPVRSLEKFGDFSTYSSGVGNIFFANGDQDPWADYSLRECGESRVCSDGIVTWMIEDGAHHADLMFSNENDPESFKRVRRAQVKSISQWVDHPREAVLFIA